MHLQLIHYLLIKTVHKIRKPACWSKGICKIFLSKCRTVYAIVNLSNTSGTIFAAPKSCDWKISADFGKGQACPSQKLVSMRKVKLTSHSMKDTYHALQTRMRHMAVPASQSFITTSMSGSGCATATWNKVELDTLVITFGFPPQAGIRVHNLSKGKLSL